MSSGLRDRLEADLDAVFFNVGDFAEPAVITWADGTQSEVRVLWDRSYRAVDPETMAEIQSAEPRCRVRTADLGQRPTQVAVRGELWRVVEERFDGQGVTELYLQRDALP